MQIYCQVAGGGGILWQLRAQLVNEQSQQQQDDDNDDNNDDEIDE